MSSRAGCLKSFFLICLLWIHFVLFDDNLHFCKSKQTSLQFWINKYLLSRTRVIRQYYRTSTSATYSPVVMHRRATKFLLVEIQIIVTLQKSMNILQTKPVLTTLKYYQPCQATLRSIELCLFWNIPKCQRTFFIWRESIPSSSQLWSHYK